jgi:F0F1-type ATP synthase membrane subunit b/b'
MIAINFTLIVQLAIVLGLMVVLGQVIFKPFLAILQERKDRVTEAEKKARSLQQQTEELIKQYRDGISAAQIQGAMIRERIRKESLTRETEGLQAATEEANRLIREMKEKIAEQTEATRITLQSQSQALSREIAERILGRSIP